MVFDKRLWNFLLLVGWTIAAVSHQFCERLEVKIFPADGTIRLPNSCCLPTSFWAPSTENLPQRLDDSTVDFR
jgi:hypothetical protein